MWIGSPNTDGLPLQLPFLLGRCAFYLDFGVHAEVPDALCEQLREALDARRS
jgi:hypothetical protein